MRIACSQCEARYDLPDEKLGRGAVKIRCKRCGHVFIVKKRADVVPPPVEAKPEARPEDFDFSAFDRFAERTLEPGATSEARKAAKVSRSDEFNLSSLLGAPSAERPTGNLEPAPGSPEDAAGSTTGPGDPGLAGPGTPPKAAPERSLSDEFDLSSLLGVPGAASHHPGEVAAPTDVPGGGPFDDLRPDELDADGPGFDAAASKGSLSDEFDLSSFEPPPAALEPQAQPADAAVTSTAGGGSEVQFDDFDFGSFEGSASPGAGAPPAEKPAAERKPSVFEDEELPSLGELDLGDFGEVERLGFEESPREEERAGRGGAERVSQQDLVSVGPRAREVQVQGLSDDLPRLDLQKGPRRTETTAKPSRTAPRDRRRSPLFWAVVFAALGTASYTGYNVWRNPWLLDFLTPEHLKDLWLSRQVEAKFSAEDLAGYPQTLPGGRRIFVIRGKVVNNSATAQGLVRVRGNLFGTDGGKIGASEVYCGNVLSDRDLAMLPRGTVEARLQNQVGEALSNVDIAPGAKVPFMVVFFSPPPKVAQFNVTVTAARKGPGS